MPKKVQIFSYDVGAEGFPNGIPHSVSPPEDLTGEKYGNGESDSDLPGMILFPANDKGYHRFDRGVYSKHILEWITDAADNSMPKAKSQGLQDENGKEFGLRD